MGYEICWEPQGGVLKRFSGQITSCDIVAADLEVEADSRYKGLRYVLNDFLGVDDFSYDSTDSNFMSALYCATSLSNPGIKVAFVTTSSDIGAFVNQYDDSPRNDYPAETFASLAEARQWTES